MKIDLTGLQIFAAGSDIMRFGVESDKGKIRELNEDYFNILSGNEKVPLTFIIADGWVVIIPVKLPVKWL